MDQLTVRFFDSRDTDDIERLRHEYFASRNLKEQRIPGGDWWVADHAGAVVAVMQVEHVVPSLCVHQLFADDTRWGKLGAGAILKRVCEYADLNGLELFGVTMNSHIVEHAIKRGWRIAGMALTRPPKET